MVEHLREEVPVEANIRSQIGYGQAEHYEVRGILALKMNGPQIDWLGLTSNPTSR